MDARRIETSWWGPPPEDAPTLVLLHEGLGCVSLWRDFPKHLADATGCGVFAYSRYGYGHSDPEPLPWPVSYMHREAEQVLPGVLDRSGVRRYVLIGHSDGASIAAIHGGGIADARRAGIVMIAPHFFTEDAGLASIAAIRTQYENGNLRARLARHHAHVDNAFHGWNGAWLDPRFRDWNILNRVPRIDVPMLLLQGTQDEYGSAEQVYAAARAATAPVETVLIEGCGHAPHLEKPAEAMGAIVHFIGRVL
jgi:pimeloyl-ACP methyl ester carboxylesterase